MEIVICEGDETGHELLVDALRILDPNLLGIPIELHRFDLSLENRRRAANAVLTDTAAAMLDVGFDLKAATITPPAADDVASPNRILREAIGDAYGAWLSHGGVKRGSATRKRPGVERIDRRSCRATAEVTYRPARIDAAYAGLTY